jgi:hypothetical protein
VGERRVQKDRNIQQTPLIAKQIAAVFVDSVIPSSHFSDRLSASPPLRLMRQVLFLNLVVGINGHMFLKQLSNPVSGSTLQ